jgi:hypothetical protein
MKSGQIGKLETAGKDAAEEGQNSGSEIEKHPSAAKANANLAPVMARLKSSPFKASLLLILVAMVGAAGCFAQEPASASEPIAIVPLDNRDPDKGATVTGALEVAEGKAIIAASGTITSGAETTYVVLPHRGVLRVCASTTVKLAADASVPAGETPGLMMAMDHGAVEASFATGQNSDILLTPDFRILIGGPGAAEVKVRLGERGDTCVDNAGVPSDRSSSLGWNAGVNAPYVLVSSVFDGGAYRVQAGQRVMFQHGSLKEVVDQEKEPCGCPPAAAKGNEFPLAQSEGLAPLAAPAPNAVNVGPAAAAPIAPLVYSSPDHAPEAVEIAPPAAAAETPAVAPANPPSAKKKPGFFGRIGQFFRKIFGAE